MSQASITREGDALVLRVATISRLLWCGVPLLAAALGAAGLLFVRQHNRKADPPSPSAVNVRIFSIAVLAFACVLGIFLIPSLFAIQIRITPTEITQDVGLWWDQGVRRFRYADIEEIFVTTTEGDTGLEPLWQIFRQDGVMEEFNPGDLWSANQQLIADQLRKHGVAVFGLE